MKTIKNVILLFVAFALLNGNSLKAKGVKKDRLDKILQKELMRNFEVMKKLKVPVYYISLRVEEEQTAFLQSSHGGIDANSNYFNRNIAISMRVGDRKFDNMHYTGNLRNNYRYTLPDTDVEEDIRLSLWRALQQTYLRAVDELEENKTRLKTDIEQEDKSPDFSIEKPNHYYQKPLKFSELNFNEKKMSNDLKTYSQILSDNKDILYSNVYISVSNNRAHFMDTDGASIIQNVPYIFFMINGVTLAPDGMVLEDYKTYVVRNMNELPKNDQITKDVKKLSATLSALKKAPKIDVYNGPVLLGSDVSGVFFHEFLGHRLEGTRMKSGYDAQTLKKKIGELVLPNRISVTLNPTINRYKGLKLSGDYKFDDEGVKAQKVEAIKNGVLKNFLMNRVELNEFSHSNGHGRGNLNVGTEARQSNLIVESNNPVSMEKLNEIFIKEIKKKGLKFGYRIDKVSGGLTMTNAASANAFYLKPLVVYRVYADGRPDELVRGVNIIGTPMTAFSQIIAESKEQSVFNGMCGALSGYVPVSAVAPNMLIKQLEFQKIGDEKRTNLPILPRP